MKETNTTEQAKMTKIDNGNNETASIGVAEHNGEFVAMTLTDSKWFKTRKGAEKWLAKRGYDVNGNINKK